MVNATGTTEIWNERSTDAVGLAVTNVQELAAVGVKGEITGGSSYQVGFKDSLTTGTADSVTIALDGATITNLGVGGMTAANEFETLNISATGTNVVTNLDSGYWCCRSGCHQEHQCDGCWQGNCDCRCCCDCYLG